jgi:hypothetical protein
MIALQDGDWSQVEPVGGYTHTIIDNPASPFDPGTPCYSGFHEWQPAQFDLADYADQVVRVMFRFGSDGYTTEEGWYIDDVLVCNTDTGSMLEVHPMEGMTVWFDHISEPGQTLVEVGATGPPLGPDWDLPLDPPVFYDITTSATCSGTITVCFEYDEGALTEDEEDLLLLHYNGIEWVDVTSSLDIESNTICGATTELSPFVLAVEADCCEGRVGDVNGINGDEPSIGDVSQLIDAKFITGSCDGLIWCYTEADINQSGGKDPNCDELTIGDVSNLIDYLFITGPEEGFLPDCL